MKKFGSLVLVLVMVLTSVSALAGWVPEGFNPACGDKGGLISAEIDKVNDKGVVTDAARLANLGTGWQSAPATGKLNRNYYTWVGYSPALYAEVEDLFGAFELAAQTWVIGGGVPPVGYPGSTASFVTWVLRDEYRKLTGLSFANGAEFVAHLNSLIVNGEIDDLDESSFVTTAALNTFVKALKNATARFTPAP